MGAPTITWSCDVWFGEDGRLYCEVRAEEYERASPEDFDRVARRNLQREAKKLGITVPSNTNTVKSWEPWGRPEVDWATCLPMTQTIRTVEPVLVPEVAA